MQTQETVVSVFLAKLMHDADVIVLMHKHRIFLCSSFLDGMFEIPRPSPVEQQSMSFE